VVQQDHTAYDGMTSAQQASFDNYFVVRTPVTARRFLDHSWPGTQTVDGESFGRIAGRWPIALGTAVTHVPTLIVAGRQDSVVGFADSVRLLPEYPSATLAVLNDAGHALPHEKPRLFAALLHEWLDKFTFSSR
jgi:pimeloyl-ACP methyl ester carboxylesterase